MVTDAIWRKGPGLILRPNPGCTSVIHGRICSQNDSRSLIPENRFFGWNFYLMKMINSMSLLTCPPDSFPGMTELHAGNDSYLYQDSPLLLHLWPIFGKQLHQLWDKFRMLVLPFFFDTHHTLWAIGWPNLHESFQNLLEKIYASLYGKKMTCANFQSFRSPFTIPTEPGTF